MNLQSISLNPLNLLNVKNTLKAPISNAIRPNVSFLGNLEKDTVSFKGNSQRKEAIEELVEIAGMIGVEGETDEESIENLVKTTKQYEELASGSEGEVYNILLSDDLMLKTMDRSDRTGLSEEKTKIQDELNNVVYRGKNFLIIKRIEGIDSCKTKSMRTIKEFSKIVASMPQSAYDDLLENIGKVHKEGFFYDNLGYNLIVDIENGKFRTFDIYDNDKYADYEKIEQPNSICEFTIDPIECFSETVKMGNSKHCYPMFLAKLLKSVATDFTYFPMFDIEGSQERVTSITDSEELENTDIMYEKLCSIQDKKKQLANDGLDNEEIKAQMQEEVEEFCKFVDENNHTQDFTMHEMRILGKYIDLKYLINKKEQKAEMIKPQGFTGNYEEDMMKYKKYARMKKVIAYMTEQVIELKKEVDKIG